MGWFSSNPVVANIPTITQKNEIHSMDGMLVIADIILLIFICVILYILIKAFLKNFKQRILNEVMDNLQRRPAINHV